MQANAKIAINSLIIFLRLCVVSVIGLYASRLVLAGLGISDYGLYNVVGGIVVLLNVVNTAMMSSTYRYIAFEIGKSNNGNPNKIFNTSLSIHVGFALLILFVGFSIGIWYINNYLNVAPGKLPDARFVFLFSILTAFVNTVFVPFSGLMVAQERFAPAAIIEIGVQIAKLVAIIMLFKVGADNLRIYAVIMLGVTVCSSLGNYLYCRFKDFPIIKFRIYKDIILIKQMLSFTWWTLIGAIANIGKTQGSAVLINWFFGTMINAAYAVGTQVDSYIQMFARSLNNAAIPQITKNYGGGNVERSIFLTANISKYTFFLMLLVAFPVLLEIKFLLNLWLEDVPNGAIIFCKLMILGALFSTLGEGIPAMINATGKIKAYQLVVNLLLFSGLPIAWIFYKLNFSFFTISLVYCVIYAFIGFVKLYMLHRVVKFDYKEFFSISYSKILIVSVPLVCFYFLYGSLVSIKNYHVAGLIFSETFVILTIFILGLSKSEKNKVKSYLFQKIKFTNK